MLKKGTILILDLDGVLITTPSWKSDEMDTDGYSVFNSSCVDNLNKLLSLFNFEIWLISSRRTEKSIKEFHQIFEHRNISKKISGFVPQYTECRNRKEEVIEFLNEFKPEKYLIIDDDKSLNGLESEIKKNLISTSLMKGFNEEKRQEAIDKMK